MLDAWSMSQRGPEEKTLSQDTPRKCFSQCVCAPFYFEGELKKSVKVSCSGNLCCADRDISSNRRGVAGSLRKRFPDLVGKSLILFLGRIHYKKQPDLLIRAFGAISGRFPEARLVLAGPADAEYRKELQHLADDLGLQGKVVWPGLLDRELAADAFRSADLFVLPSLQENFGISVAEAMAAGCPVIVSEQVDLAVDVKTSSAGIVCANDLDAVADGMALLLSNPSQRNSMGENGRRLIGEKFSTIVVAQELQQVYDDICNDRVTSSAWR